MVSAEAGLLVHEGLITRVTPIRTYSLLEMATHLKRFVAYQDTIDTAIAELPPELNEAIQDVLATRDYPLKFPEVGHTTILFNYIAKKIGETEIRYTVLQDYPQVLAEVKEGMKRKNQRGLYQVCMEEHQSEIEALLKKEQFRVI